MKLLALCLLPLAFGLLISANPPPPITPTPTRARMTVLLPKATPTLSLTKPAPIHKLRYVYWLPWVSMSGTTFAIGVPPLPACEWDHQSACAIPTLAVPPTEQPPTAYP